jgi:uncharacterized protein (TIGR03790 family)
MIGAAYQRLAVHQRGWRTGRKLAVLCAIMARVLSAFVLLSLAACPVSAQTGDNVLVIANAASTVSVDIAEYYARTRAIPADQILRLALPVAEEIERTAYETEIERPVREWLRTHAAEDRILYLVLTKDVPIRISGSTGRDGTVASVDSELTILYRKQYRGSLPLRGPLENPYFLADRPIASAKPFTHRDDDIYLVARLDGYRAADIEALIDRGLTASREGRIVLDPRVDTSPSPGNAWLERAATVLQALPGWGDRTMLAPGPGAIFDEPTVFGYYSWGSNDPRAVVDATATIAFVPGALAAMFAGADARTFQPPPQGWTPRAAPFAGSNQSLVGDLIRAGVTGTAGHVSDPYLDGTIRPDVLFPAYVSGYNLIEAFYLAMPYVGWQTVVVGDPLSAPFPRPALTPGDLDPELDAVTGLPAFLSQRRVAAAAAAGGADPAAARLFVAAETRAGLDDAATRELLEQATELDGSYVQAQLLLAGVYETAGEWDAAIRRYRRVIEDAPTQPIALNNLAYLLAERMQRPAEALPLATRAFAAAENDPMIADTLGWIHHLLGNHHLAETLVLAAAKALPQTADVHLHAAVVLEANGKTDLARASLERALTLNTALESDDDVRALQSRLAR